MFLIRSVVRDLNHDGSYSADELIEGLRSGNSFIAQDDLIVGLQFSVRCQQRMKEVVTDRDVLMPQVPRTAQERQVRAAGKPLSIKYRACTLPKPYSNHKRIIR